MERIQVDNENPSQHWKFINCKDKIVLDLGCGRWEHVEHRDPSWPTTPEYLIQIGAKEVHAIDIDEKEINWYKEIVSTKMPVFPIHRQISSTDDISDLIRNTKATVIKCDIEGSESGILNLSNEDFYQIKFYAIETHSDALYESFIKKFNDMGYTHIATIDLVHAPPMKVIFAEKI